MVEGANKSIPSFLNFIKLVGNDIYMRTEEVYCSQHTKVLGFFINSVNLNIV
jgi:hypothetical protein